MASPSQKYDHGSHETNPHTFNKEKFSRQNSKSKINRKSSKINLKQTSNSAKNSDITDKSHCENIIKIQNEQFRELWKDKKNLGLEEIIIKVLNKKLTNAKENKTQFNFKFLFYKNPRDHLSSTDEKAPESEDIYEIIKKSEKEIQKECSNAKIESGDDLRKNNILPKNLDVICTNLPLEDDTENKLNNLFNLLKENGYLIICEDILNEQTSDEKKLESKKIDNTSSFLLQRLDLFKKIGFLAENENFLASKYESNRHYYVLLKPIKE